MRARSLLGTRVDGYRRAQESFENSKAAGPAVGSEVMRRRKELERRRKNEEEAHNKVFFFRVLIFYLINELRTPYQRVSKRCDAKKKKKKKQRKYLHLGKVSVASFQVICICLTVFL